MDNSKDVSLLPDGTVYSRRKNFCPFSIPALDVYASVLGEERIERVQRAAQRLKGLELMEVNATAQGGGVAEMLYSSIPFLNALGIKAEWKVIRGNKDYYECTKNLHNQLQGMKGSFTQEMQHIYFSNLEQSARGNLIDNSPYIVVVHDPQPLGLTRYLKKPGETWLWRCHIDIEEAAMRNNAGLWESITNSAMHYNAAIFSAGHYVVSDWPLPSFIIPPFIDPLSEKNREMTEKEINKVLAKYNMDPRIPIIAQVGRFDPWKGIGRTIATYRRVRKQRKCQLVLAGGIAADDPEGERILARIYEETKNDEGIHVLNLSLTPRLENYLEVNALQRAASVIMQPSTREGFGLVITEALWKGKPVIASDVGAIPLQVIDGDNGYFYQSAHRTAQKVDYLLENPQAAEIMGRRGKKWVESHFLLADRIVDYLMGMDMTVNKTLDRDFYADCIISFHPWFKLNRWRRNPPPSNSWAW